MSHLEVLRQHYVFLKDQLDVTEILDQLYQDKVFSHSDLDDCKAKQGRSAQCEELLSILKRKGKNGYDRFLQVLERCQPHIKLKLDSTGRETSTSEAYKTASFSTADMNSRISNLEMDIATRDSTISRLQQELLKLRKDKSGAEREAFQAKHEAELLKVQVESLETEISAHKQTIDSLQTSLMTETKKGNDAKREVTLQGQRSKQFDTTVKSLKKDVEDYSATVEELQLTLVELGISSYPTYHHLSVGENQKRITLKCLQLKFDRDRVNINKVHINTEGELVNKPDTRPHDHSKDRLVKYWGTTSTVPIPLCGSPQYWEMKAKVCFDKNLTENNLLLEIGLSVEEERDQHYCIETRPHSYSLIVSHCKKHSSICRKVWKHGKYVLCLPDTLPNIPGQSTALHYGVVFDSTRAMAVFMDLTNNKVMSVIDGVDCSQPLWPMFGVYYPSGSVSMSLVVGNDIDMSEGKKSMILTSLS